MSIKKVGALIIISILIFLIYGKRGIKKSPNSSKLKVTVSFYPLEFLAKRIGGDQVAITNLTPPGAEPHDFEPSTRDTVQLENQDVVLLNGGGLEGYADKIKENIDLKKTKLIVVGQPLMSDSKDPHVWLDPVLYKKEAKVIADVFVNIDPIHSLFYNRNAQKLLNELDELDLEFKNGLSNCKQKNIITSHKAFGYLANRYSLHEIALAGLSPEQEPSSKTLVEVATFAKANKIRYIFFEELINPSIAQTIAREVGAKTLVFNPLEGLTKDDMNGKKTYMTIQRENLANLQIALECQ